jgi:hypothetical protein
MLKQGRNDKCACNSGKKYKKCCGGAPLFEPQKIHTAAVNVCFHRLHLAFPSKTLIDMTQTLTESNYLSIMHYFLHPRFIVMAERTPLSESLFQLKTPAPENKLMIMHHGSYLTFSPENTTKAVEQMVGQNWVHDS